MFIDEIEINNYRNYERAAVALDRGLNVVSGKNASGKTNLVEAVYYAALGKSPRVSRDKELIKWGCDSLDIKIKLTKKYRSFKVNLSYDGANKKFLLDGIPITRTSDIIGLINVVFFSPDELSIVKDGPQERRRYMDMSLSQQKKSYFTDLVNYNKIIEQRNKLLKTRLGSEEMRDVAEIYNIQLAQYGARIINNRYLFIDKLQSLVKGAHSFLTNGGESLVINYESKIKRAGVSEMQAQLIDLLNSTMERDRQLQYTGIGPHRDDMSLVTDGVDVRKYGSQGQQRTVALTLKMSEVKLFEEESGEPPILILDDVLSELDCCRRQQLLTYTKGTQTILTCTEFDGECDKHIRIDNGKIL